MYVHIVCFPCLFLRATTDRDGALAFARVLLRIVTRGIPYTQPEQQGYEKKSNRRSDERTENRIPSSPLS